MQVDRRGVDGRRGDGACRSVEQLHAASADTFGDTGCAPFGDTRRDTFGHTRCDTSGGALAQDSN